MINPDLGIELNIKGLILDSRFTRHFGAAPPKSNRMVWIAGIRSRSWGWSIMIQIYRPGMMLDWHQDGYGIHNFVWTWVFWKPKVGGNIEVEGPHKKWGPFHFFDGGVYKHRVTTCGGYRSVIMLQRMKKLERKDDK